MIASRRESVSHRYLGYHLLFVVVVFVVLQGATLPAQEPPGDSIEGWTEDQVREALGRPSIRDRQPDGTVWYYDGTSKGTVRVYFTNGRVTRVIPEDGFRELWLKELARRSAEKSSDAPVDPRTEPEQPAPDTEDVSDLALADSSLTQPVTDPGDPDESDRQIEIRPDSGLAEAVENLRRSLRSPTPSNRSGDTGRSDPEIQFDTKGADFGQWMRDFKAQVRKNWFVPYAIWSEHGNVVITFNVHRNGALTDLSVAKPARVEAFTHSAANAIRASSPTQPLPPEYPDGHSFITVTFYFNELPPER